MIDEINILVVEDDEYSYLYLKIVLESLDYKVFRAINGLQALEMISDTGNYFKLVMMDYKMPVMNGLEAALEIKKINPAIPVILQTATYIDKKSSEPVFAIFDDILIKPFTNKDLIEKIKHIFLRQENQSKSKNQFYLM
ncbi:MAG: response regulator [Bacteroidales bacterium]